MLSYVDLCRAKAVSKHINSRMDNDEFHDFRGMMRLRDGYTFLLGSVDYGTVRITEVFGSRISTWTIAQDLPGPEFALNEYQTGVCLNRVLFYVGALEGENLDKCVLAFSVDQGKWLPHLSFPLLNSTYWNIVQLVESNRVIFLFSEIENSDWNVMHCIDQIEHVTHRTDLRSNNLTKYIGELRNLVSQWKAGGRWLQVYPEFTCVSFGDEKLCIFYTIMHMGIVYDVLSHGQCIETLPSPSWSRSRERGFYSMNPLTFSFEPSFKGKP